MTQGNTRGRTALLTCLAGLVAALFWGAPLTLGQSGASRLFEEANLLYQQQKYAAAAEKYSQIAASGQISAPLLYNLGNCYYKLNQIGRAILNYERARRLDPGDPDIAANLETAILATVDRIVVPEDFALALWIRSTLRSVPLSATVRLGLFLYLFGSALLVVRILARDRRVITRISQILALTGACIILVILFGSLQWIDSRNRIEAVVQSREAIVRSSPGIDGVPVFSVHEGTKVRIEQATGDWIEVILPDGKSGWVQSDAAEII